MNAPDSYINDITPANLKSSFTLKRLRWIVLPLVSLIVIVVLASQYSRPSLVHADPVISEYPIPDPPAHSNANSITMGPDGALWFTLNGANQIGRISTTGQVTKYDIPTPNALDLDYSGIITGPDGALWFTEPHVSTIGRITSGGTITEYYVPPQPGYSVYNPEGITVSPDGALWFTSRMPGTIGRITTSGDVTEYQYTLPANFNYSGPHTITVGPDGALWFAAGYNVGRITLQGATTIYPIGYSVGNLVTGADGALWFTNIFGNRVGRLTTDGNYSFYSISGYESGFITVGSDNALWFTLAGTPAGGTHDSIGRITTDGSISIYPLPTQDVGMYYSFITNGPDGAIWFNEYTQNNIGRIAFQTIPSAPLHLSATSPTLKLSLIWDAVANATTYNIYRDGSTVGSSPTNNYTDTGASPGSHSYYVTAVNSAGESGPSNTITVYVGTLPGFTSGNMATATARNPFSFTVTTTGSPTAAISESGSLPSGITFHDNGDGTATFSGQASPVNQGYYFITLTATNSLGSATQSFTLAVNNAQTAPTFLTPNSTTASYGVPFSFTVDTTGNPIPNITKSGSLPNGIKFQDNNDGTATLSGTIKGSATHGSSTFSLQVKNKNGTATETFTVTW